MSDKRLLVVDDEKEIGEFIRAVAEDMGYTVMVATTAEDFLKAYATFKPSHIMMDIVMPDVDGIELLRHLAAQGCQAKVMLMSGFSEKYLDSAEKLSDAYGLPSVQRLIKPIRLAKLREILSN